MLQLCGVMLDLGAYVFHAVVTMHFSLYHTLPYSSHPQSLIVWPKKESLSRTTNPSRPPSCLKVFSSVKIIWSVGLRSSQSNWFIDPQFCWFDPFLISFRQPESTLLRRMHFALSCRYLATMYVYQHVYCLFGQEFQNVYQRICFWEKYELYWITLIYWKPRHCSIWI